MQPAWEQLDEQGFSELCRFILTEAASKPEYVKDLMYAGRLSAVYVR